MQTEPIHLEPQEAEPLDAETLAAIDLGDEQLRRGEVVTLEQANINLKKRIEAWRKEQKEALTA